MNSALDPNHPWMHARIELHIREINAEYFTPEVFDEWGKPLRPMTDEEWEAEFDRRAGRTFFRVTAAYGQKRHAVESPMVLSKDREEVLQQSFAAVARSFFNHYHSQPHVTELASPKA